MFSAFPRLLMPPIPLVMCVSLASCSKSAARLDGDVQQSAALAPPRMGCTGTWLGPSVIPPDPGMWTNDGSGGARVVTMIGPTDVRVGSTAVTRTIETIEGVGTTQPIHTRAAAAVMHLELLPRSPVDGRGVSSGGTPADRSSEPAAAYSLTPLISVVAYEACAAPPAIRYLRRDAHGVVARDVMLRRVSGLK